MTADTATDVFESHRPVLTGVAYRMLALLAPDVRLVGDSGGKSRAPLRVIESADKVGRFLFAVAHDHARELDFRLLELNGGPGLLLFLSGKVDAVVQLDIEDGLIQCVYIVRNPDKLARLTDLSEA